MLGPYNGAPTARVAVAVMPSVAGVSPRAPTAASCAGSPGPNQIAMFCVCWGPTLGRLLRERPLQSCFFLLGALPRAPIAAFVRWVPRAQSYCDVLRMLGPYPRAPTARAAVAVMPLVAGALARAPTAASVRWVPQGVIPTNSSD